MGGKAFLAVLTQAAEQPPHAERHPSTGHDDAASAAQHAPAAQARARPAAAKRVPSRQSIEEQALLASLEGPPSPQKPRLVSVQLALLTPRVNHGSLYRCGKSTSEQPISHGGRKGA